MLQTLSVPGFACSSPTGNPTKLLRGPVGQPLLGTSAVLHEPVIGATSLFVSQLFLMKNLKCSEKLKEESSAHLCTCHPDPAVVHVLAYLSVFHRRQAAAALRPYPHVLRQAPLSDLLLLGLSHL